MAHAHVSIVARTRAKRLRREMTDAEMKLWSELRAHRLTDLHFRRQAAIGPYIADFVCHAAKLIVELDGEQHAQPGHATRDLARDHWFASHGYLTLRFWNHEVLRELSTATDTIFARCAERLSFDHPVNSPPSLTLPHKGGGALEKFAPRSQTADRETGERILDRKA